MFIYGKWMVSGSIFPRQYLLWTLKNLLDIIKGSEFLEKLTFSQLCGFIKSHKQFVYNKSIPHTSCLWDTCKIIVLLAKGLNNYKRLTASVRLPETPRDVIENSSCSSDDKDCMFDDCAECSPGKLCQLPDSNPDSESEWILILIPVQAAWYLSTVGKHSTIIIPKYASVTLLMKRPRRALSRDIFIKKYSKTIIIIT